MRAMFVFEMDFLCSLDWINDCNKKDLACRRPGENVNIPLYFLRCYTVTRPVKFTVMNISQQ